MKTKAQRYAIYQKAEKQSVANIGAKIKNVASKGGTGSKTLVGGLTVIIGRKLKKAKKATTAKRKKTNTKSQRRY